MDANYRVHPDDQLALILTGDVEASYSLPVSREGFIVIPQVGQVYVNDLTLAEVVLRWDQCRSRCGDRYRFIGAQ